MKHPDALPGEVYLGNTTRERMGSGVGWKTLRVAFGSQAYDIGGNKVSGIPYFVQASEMEAGGVAPRGFSD